MLATGFKGGQVFDVTTMNRIIETLNYTGSFDNNLNIKVWSSEPDPYGKITDPLVQIYNLYITKNRVAFTNFVLFDPLVHNLDPINTLGHSVLREAKDKIGNSVLSFFTHIPNDDDPLNEFLPTKYHDFDVGFFEVDDVYRPFKMAIITNEYTVDPSFGTSEDYNACALYVSARSDFVSFSNYGLCNIMN